MSRGPTVGQQWCSPSSQQGTDHWCHQGGSPPAPHGGGPLTAQRLLHAYTHLFKPCQQQHSSLDGEPAHVVVCALCLLAEWLADVEAWHVKQACAGTQLGKGSSCIWAGSLHHWVPADAGAKTEGEGQGTRQQMLNDPSNNTAQSRLPPCPATSRQTHGVALHAHALTQAMQARSYYPVAAAHVLNAYVDTTCALLLLLLLRRLLAVDVPVTCQVHARSALQRTSD